MTILWLDLVTFSACDLKQHGTHRYAKHPSTEIIVVQWALDDELPTVCDCTLAEPPVELAYLLAHPNVIVAASNSQFGMPETKAGIIGESGPYDLTITGDTVATQATQLLGYAPASNPAGALAASPISYVDRKSVV